MNKLIKLSAGLDMRKSTNRNLTIEDIESRLQKMYNSKIDKLHLEHNQIRNIYNLDPIPAAVLIPLLRKNKLWHILFTRRNQNLPEHSGQVAFPGGRCDLEDINPETTALREAKEEIGIQPEDVKVIGKLQNFLTVTNYCVTPIVGVIPWPYQFYLSKVEVSRVFTIPLNWLANPKNYYIRERTLPQTHGKISVIYFHEYEGEILWGASARFILNLVEILFK